MLDRSKLLLELHKMQHHLVAKSDRCLSDACSVWEKIGADDQVSVALRLRKWSILVPDFQGTLGQVFSIQSYFHPYRLLAVDGSQIYYDKHQGPACCLINIGSVFFSYGIDKSVVKLSSEPELVVATGQNFIDMDPNLVNLYRDQQELKAAVSQSIEYTKSENNDFLCMLDGSMIFFQIDLQMQGHQSTVFAQFMDSLNQWYLKRILHVSYISFAKNKDLLNIVRLAAADYLESNLKQTENWYKLSDMDIMQFFLPAATRCKVFQSKAPITYAYPAHLRPYFCYVNTGEEIVRLEFPSWIATDESLVDKICGMVLNQIEKGRGYPVALFEAHEQAVVKAAEREFFYEYLQKLSVKHSGQYQRSKKSLKKIQVPI